MVEIELTSSVPSLGSRGERKIVSPGYARNTLVPAGQAVYVVKGRGAVHPVRTVLVARAVEAARERAARRLEEEEKARREREDNKSDVLLQARRAEEQVLAALTRLTAPIEFSRRTISSASTSSTAASKEIFGSVTTNDVVQALRDVAGVAITSSSDDGHYFAEAEGVVNGRLKAIGTFDFIVNFKALQQEAVVRVVVRPDDATSAVS